MKTITVRRPGSIRLTSAAHPLYGATCTVGGGGGGQPAPGHNLP
jgi:hypothetical protein